MPKKFKRQKKKGKNDFIKAKSKIRLAKENGEIYAKVLTLFGNGMADVLCNDGKRRLLVIRRRFKGRNKRDNNVAIDKILLVGMREWEVIAEKKKQKVDLLYVYNDEDIHDLKNDSNLNSDILPDKYKLSEGDNPFDITNKKDWSKEWQKEQEEKKIEEVMQESGTNCFEEAVPDFDFDDI